MRDLQAAVSPAERRLAQQLDIAGALNLNFTEQLADSLPKFRLNEVVGRRVAEQFATSLPKLDIAAILPRTRIPDLYAASLPLTLGVVPTPDDGREQEEGEQLSSSGAADEQEPGSGGGFDDTGEEHKEK
ncbi:hypothetical protein [Streptomyces sp. 3N207]|uniref:hypothetical protein n=1 Tax=Streptomyces sp. 3N207 TaxID=3457417 RepID=UPI003FD0B041